MQNIKKQNAAYSTETRAHLKKISCRIGANIKAELTPATYSEISGLGTWAKAMSNFENHKPQ